MCILYAILYALYAKFLVYRRQISPSQYEVKHHRKFLKASAGKTSLIEAFDLQRSLLQDMERVNAPRHQLERTLSICMSNDHGREAIWFQRLSYTCRIADGSPTDQYKMKTCLLPRSDDGKMINLDNRVIFFW